jgi:alpha-tubulin suppressor-like RCC1 family protein
VTAIAGGAFDGYALRSDGTVWAWGEGAGLGDNSSSESNVPVPVSGLIGVTAIATGQEDGYALRSDGYLWAWGAGTLGQLGNNTTPSVALLPVEVSGLAGVIAIGGGPTSVDGYAIEPG